MRAQKISLEDAWPKPDRTHVQAAVEKLVRAFDPLKVIAFGSYARGEARHGSDLDLLVVLPRVTDKREAAVAMRSVLRELPVPKDIIVSTPQEIEERGWIVGTLLRQALQEGETVYERTEAK